MADQRGLFEYQRRNPETSLLYRTVQNHMLTHLGQLERVGTNLPKFIKVELFSFTRCGILAHGFCRIRCKACRVDKHMTASMTFQGLSEGGIILGPGTKEIDASESGD